MIKNLLFGFLMLCSAAGAQTVYNGNTKTGFGGTIGNGSLTISDNGTDITLALATAGSFNDILVVYFDSKTGGFANTTTFNDQSDGGRRAISGKSGSGTSNVSFPDGFNADYGLAWGNFGSVLFELAAGGDNSLVFKNFNASTSTVTFPKSMLGIDGAVIFKLIGTYVAESAYRSNEALVENIGNGSEGGGNFGFNSIRFAAAQLYPSTILNLDLKSFSAASAGKDVLIAWQLNCNSGRFADLLLEKSNNGLSFQTVYQERVSSERCQQPFSFTDAFVGGGTIYYRLQYTSADGETKTSNVARVEKTPVSTLSLAMQPTWVSSTANIQVSAPGGEPVQLRITDMQGKALQTQMLRGNGGSQQVLLQAGMYRPGVYLVTLSDERGNTQVMRFVKQ